MGNGFFPGGYGPTNQWPTDFFPDAPSVSEPQPLKLERVVFMVNDVRQVFVLDNTRRVFVCR